MNDIKNNDVNIIKSGKPPLYSFSKPYTLEISFSVRDLQDEG